MICKIINVEVKARGNERQYVTNVLTENNYPKSFLHDCLRRILYTMWRLRESISGSN